MFYSVQILNKKGPLGVIWIAAHLDRRLKRSQVNDTSIPSSVDSIMNPEAPLALRLSSQLLLGVVRIYSRKVGYLFEDCNHALSKIKQAFKAQELELPRGGQTAPLASITLPDNFDDLQLPFFSDNLFESLGELPEGAPIELNFGSRRQSMMLMEDNSDIFMSQRSGFEDEEFEAGGEDLEGHIRAITEERRRRSQTPGSLEPELARAANVNPNATPAALDFGAGTPRTPGSEVPSNGKGMQTAADAPAETPAKLGLGLPTRPPSEPPSAGAGPSDAPLGDGMSPFEDDFLPALPDADAGMLDVQAPPTPPGSVRKTPLADGLLQPAETAAEPAATEEAAGLAEAAPAEGTATADAAAAEVAQQAAPAAARQRRGGLSKRKRPRLDVNADGRPATQLPSRAVHALLQDRSSLLTSRGRGHLPHIDEEEEAQPLMQPSTGNLRSMAPALAQLFESRMKAGASKRATGRARQAEAAATAAAEPSQAEADDGMPVNADEAGPSQAATPGAAGGNQEMPAQDAMDVDIPATGTDLAEAVPGTTADQAADPGPSEQDPNFDDGMFPEGQPPDAAGLDEMGGGNEFMASPAGPGLTSPSKSARSARATARGASQGQGTTPGRSGVEQDLSARLVDQGEGEVGAMPELGAVPEEEEEEGNAAAALEVDAQTSFTARTKQVLGHLKGEWGVKDASPGKRKRSSPAKGSQANGHAADTTHRQLQLGNLVAGKSKLEAARVFFELLVLNNKGYIQLSQDEPYADIGVLPASKLASVL